MSSVRRQESTDHDVSLVPFDMGQPVSWSEIAGIFRTSWDSVFRAVEHAVDWGLAHRELSKLIALGIDEIAWSRGHR
jgi:hypothetical protein